MKASNCGRRNSTNLIIKVTRKKVKIVVEATKVMNLTVLYVIFENYRKNGASCATPHYKWTYLLRNSGPFPASVQSKFVTFPGAGSQVVIWPLHSGDVFIAFLCDIQSLISECLISPTDYNIVAFVNPQYRLNT